MPERGLKNDELELVRKVLINKDQFASEIVTNTFTVMDLPSIAAGAAISVESLINTTLKKLISNGRIADFLTELARREGDFRTEERNEFKKLAEMARRDISDEGKSGPPLSLFGRSKKVNRIVLLGEKQQRLARSEAVAAREKLFGAIDSDQIACDGAHPPGGEAPKRAEIENWGDDWGTKQVPQYGAEEALLFVRVCSDDAYSEYKNGERNCRIELARVIQGHANSNLVSLLVWCGKLESAASIERIESEGVTFCCCDENQLKEIINGYMTHAKHPPIIGVDMNEDLRYINNRLCEAIETVTKGICDPASPYPIGFEFDRRATEKEIWEQYAEFLRTNTYDTGAIVVFHNLSIIDSIPGSGPATNVFALAKTIKETIEPYEREFKRIVAIEKLPSERILKVFVIGAGGVLAKNADYWVRGDPQPGWTVVAMQKRRDASGISAEGNVADEKRLASRVKQLLEGL